MRIALPFGGFFGGRENESSYRQITTRTPARNEPVNCDRNSAPESNIDLRTCSSKALERHVNWKLGGSGLLARSVVPDEKTTAQLMTLKKQLEAKIQEPHDDIQEHPFRYSVGRVRREVRTVTRVQR